MRVTKVHPELNLSAAKDKIELKDNKRSKLGITLRQYFNVWQILRVMFAVICMAWFLYHALAIISQYTQFNTIVMIEHKAQSQTDLPAFTICGPFIILQETMEVLYPEFKLQKRFIMSHFTNATERDSAIRDQIFYYEQKAYHDFSAIELFENYSITEDYVVMQCLFISDTLSEPKSPEINCSDISPVVSSFYDGRKCFTFFSQLNNTKGERKPMLMIYEQNPQIFLKIAPISEKLIVKPVQKEVLIATLHQPNIIPTHLDLNYFRIYNDEYYDISFSKKFEYLLPYPYETNCRQYYKTNAIGQRSRGDCINNCIKRETFDLHKCANYYGILTPDLFTNEQRLCTQRLQNYSSFTNARKKCKNMCQKSCVEESYEMEQYEYPYPSHNCTIIDIKLSAHPYTCIYHVEALDETEIIGSLGGHAHMWLGLSAIKLFNMIVNLILFLKVYF